MSACHLFARRIDIEGELEVVTPLHIGSGEEEPDEVLPKVKDDQGNEKYPTSSRVLRDAIRRPYIPGTSIKGALRAIAEAAAGTGKAVKALFGEIKDDGSGAMGALTIFGATFKTAGDGGELPFNAKKKQGLYVNARTAIDKGRGTAEQGKLFHAEELAPGAVFAFRARYLPPVDKGREQDASRLLGRLLRLIETDGFALGRGAGDGQGRVHVSDLTVTSRVLGAQGTFEPAAGFDAAALLPQEHELASADTPVSLTLTCDGPFFVNDFSWDRKKQTNDGKQSDLPHLRALRWSKSKPVLPGASLMGALRGRAAWLATLAEKRGELPDGKAKEMVEFLFGTSERRAALRLDSLELVAGTAQPAMLTSVKLDRFSGAPIDGALFGIECVVGPVFEARLRFVQPRQGAEESSEHFAIRKLLAGNAEKFWSEVLGDIKKNGLMLGHAANRGFGWFDVKAKTETPS